MTEESLERRVLRRLVFQPETLSRNQNFHAFDSADGRRVLRLAARIRSLLRAITSPNTEVVCLLDGPQPRVLIDDPDTGVQRETLLSEDAFAVLIEDERAREVLLG
ncbi:MAG: hypothetical protein ACJAYU_003831 [Bradymonadia bacterium]|jgi:hypothetical protein